MENKTSGGVSWEVGGNDIRVSAPGFNLPQTLDCGQAFRWETLSDGSFSGFHLDTPLLITQTGDELLFINTTEADFTQIWLDYFDFNTDYAKIHADFVSDPILKQAIDFCGGIRLLKQDPWETLISFILSQNNNITRIKGIIKRFCGLRGKFLTAEKLAKIPEAELSEIRAGFRAKYIKDAAVKIYSGEVNLEAVKQMPLEAARNELMKIHGVGPKVADCVLLFGLHKRQAFPVDGWIKRALGEFYPEGFPFAEHEYAGIAQQYLFHYIRNK
jgi:N-glycosylase/DNA lyase